MSSQYRSSASKMKKFLSVRQKAPLTETDQRKRRRRLEDYKEPPPTFTHSLTKLIEKSTKFSVDFPITSVKTETLLKENSEEREKVLSDNFKSTYPIVHEAVIPLMIDFLEHKQIHGSAREKEFYDTMDLCEFIDRLFCKRAVSFVGSTDSYRLLSGEQGVGGWEKVGTTEESSPLLLEKCLSYDEIKISALLGASSPSYFINSGSRTNRGIPEDEREEKGIVIGVVGCRFEKPEEMEWQEMVLDIDQNVKDKGYGNLPAEKFEGKSLRSNRADFFQMWANFYGEPYLPTWEEKKAEVFRDGSEFERMRRGAFLNCRIYMERCRMTAETILLEADERGRMSGKKVFLHVVGFGLGVWQATENQEKWFLKGFSRAIKNINPPKVSDIYFGWFNENSLDGVVDGKKIEGTETVVWFGKRNPQEKLVGENEGKLLVVTYAWDGNSLPGNEFWDGSLAASGDPAQACSSQIAELQNPHINPAMAGINARVASPTLKKVVTIQEMVKYILSDDAGAVAYVEGGRTRQSPRAQNIGRCKI